MAMSAALLVKMLKRHGTGEDKLQLARRAMYDARAIGREATAEDVVKALAAGLPGGEFHLTVKKATELLDTGKYQAPTQEAKPSIEDEMLSPAEAALLAEMDKKAEAVKAADAKADVKEPEKAEKKKS